MSQEKAEKHSGFMGWYESYNGKKIVNIIYCLGASIVIIGALFKIMHFPGAGPVLMTGMITEAFLFAIGCLDKPHVDFHWEHVFPQLIGYGADPKVLEELSSKPKPTLLGGVGGGNGNGNGNGGANVPALSESEMTALKGGIADLAKTAGQLSELGKLATAETQLCEKMVAAGEATGKFVATADLLAQKGNEFGNSCTQIAEIITRKGNELGNSYDKVAEEMQHVVEGTKNYQQSVAGMGDKLASINSMYELQITALKSQNDKMQTLNNSFDKVTESTQKVAENMQKVNTTAEEALKNQLAYEEGARKLAAQVADLNKIYGNMLNALA